MVSDVWDMWKELEEPEPVVVKFNSNTLATYFQRQFSRAAWSSGFALSNHAALRGAFAKWKKAGATAEQVTAMIDAYMSQPELRGSNPGWKDFLYQREKIAASGLTTGENTQLTEWERLAMEDVDE